MSNTLLHSVCTFYLLTGVDLFFEKFFDLMLWKGTDLGCFVSRDCLPPAGEVFKWC